MTKNIHTALANIMGRTRFHKKIPQKQLKKFIFYIYKKATLQNSCIIFEFFLMDVAKTSKPINNLKKLFFYFVDKVI